MKTLDKFKFKKQRFDFDEAQERLDDEKRKRKQEFDRLMRTRKKR